MPDTQTDLDLMQLPYCCPGVRSLQWGYYRLLSILQLLSSAHIWLLKCIFQTPGCGSGELHPPRACHAGLPTSQVPNG